MFNIRQNNNNPILHPYKKNTWEAISACNGCPIKIKNKLNIVYRAIGVPDKVKAPNMYQSKIAVAELKGKCNFESRRVFIEPVETWEEYGCEDPRITKIDSKFYTFYTALSSSTLSPDSIKVAVAVSNDLKEVKERHLVTPFNAKAMALFPEKVNGKYTVILTANTDMPPAKISIAQFNKIEEIWNHQKWDRWYKEIDKHVIDLKRDPADLTEVGAPPIKTKDGWLLIYSHIQNYFSDRSRIFGIEAVLLDLKNPKKIIGRTEFPIVIPDQLYSKYGFVSDVSFPTGTIVEKDRLRIFYGAADTTTCEASLNLNALLRELKPDTKKKIFKRCSDKPILSPTKNKWESKNVFNPAAIDINGIVRILYRAQDNNNVSTIGYAESKDGKTISYRHEEPCYVPRVPEEINKDRGGYGCEDPRLTAVGNKIFMCYTAYNAVDAPQIAISNILKTDLAKRNFNWSKPIIISPKGHDDKDSCLLPKKFKKGYFMIHRISGHITGDFVNDLNFTPHEIDTSVEIVAPRKGMWDDQKIGLASTPHLLKEGWLMFYHGVSPQGIYRVGAILMDKNDPTKILGRSALPLFEPEEKWELEGEISNIVFPCGSVIRKDRVFIYYGGADRFVGVAEARLKDILNSLR